MAEPKELPEDRFKALLGRASKIHARYAVIIGENELARGVVQLRDLTHSTQHEVAFADLADVIAGTRN